MSGQACRKTSNDYLPTSYNDKGIRRFFSQSFRKTIVIPKKYNYLAKVCLLGRFGGLGALTGLNLCEGTELSGSLVFLTVGYDMWL